MVRKRVRNVSSKRSQMGNLEVALIIIRSNFRRMRFSLEGVVPRRNARVRSTWELRKFEFIYNRTGVMRLQKSHVAELFFFLD